MIKNELEKVFRQTKKDYILEQDLDLIVDENRKALEDGDKILEQFELVKHLMSEEEKDAVFQAYLGGIQEIANHGRVKLRTIIKKYIDSKVREKE